MKKHFLFILILITLWSCAQESEAKYPRMIGDIAFDPNIDDSNFNLCNDHKYAVQYYALNSKLNDHSFEEEQYGIKKHFEQYKPVKINQSGLIRIRFMVNCEGEAGRFRMLQTDKNYQSFTFDKAITNQLMCLTKSLKGWKQFKFKDLSRDYYQYLIFKIENGNLIEIMP